MKKKWVTIILLFVILQGSFAAPQEKFTNKIQAALHVWEANYFLNLFIACEYALNGKHFILAEPTRSTMASFRQGQLMGTVYRVDTPYWLRNEEASMITGEEFTLETINQIIDLSNQLINRSIKAYEAALKIEPSGKWSFSKIELNNKDNKNEISRHEALSGRELRTGTNLFSEWYEPPLCGVKLLLEKAFEYRNNWKLTTEPKVVAWLQAEQATQAETQAEDERKQAEARQRERQQIESITRPLRDDDFKVSQNADNTITITGFNISERENLIIPEKLYGLTVTRIGKAAFSGKKIQNLVIPDTIIEIEDSAFAGAGIKKVTIGRNVKIIGIHAFYHNRDLKEIIIPDSVISIEGEAFYLCGLTNLILGKGLQQIHHRAFSDNSLTTITLPLGLKYTANGVFSGNNLKEIVITGNPNNYVQFGYNNFSDNSFSRITLPANIDDKLLETIFGSGGFTNFYKNQNKRAGTYYLDGPIWKRE